MKRKNHLIFIALVLVVCIGIIYHTHSLENFDNSIFGGDLPLWQKILYGLLIAAVVIASISFTRHLDNTVIPSSPVLTSVYNFNQFFEFMLSIGGLVALAILAIIVSIFFGIPLLPMILSLVGFGVLSYLSYLSMKITPKTNKPANS